MPCYVSEAEIREIELEQLQQRIDTLERWHRIWNAYGVDWDRDDLYAAYLEGRLPLEEVRDLRDSDGRSLFAPRELFGLV